MIRDWLRRPILRRGRAHEKGNVNVHHQPMEGDLPVRNLLVAFLFLFAGTASAADNGLVTVPSRYSVAETIDRFEAAAKADKFQIFARVAEATRSLAGKAVE